MRAILPLVLVVAGAFAGLPGSTQATAANAPIVDCNDDSNLIHPGAAEVVDNGIDDDCNGLADDSNGVPSVSGNDDDGDGVTVAQGDCNDHNPAVYIGRSETVGDFVDNDCDGLADEAPDDTPSTDTIDHDGDGYPMANDRVFGDAFESA